MFVLYQLSRIGASGILRRCDWDPGFPGRHRRWGPATGLRRPSRLRSRTGRGINACPRRGRHGDTGVSDRSGCGAGTWWRRTQGSGTQGSGTQGSGTQGSGGHKARDTWRGTQGSGGHKATASLPDRVAPDPGARLKQRWFGREVPDRREGCPGGRGTASPVAWDGSTSGVSADWTKPWSPCVTRCIDATARRCDLTHRKQTCE